MEIFLSVLAIVFVIGFLYFLDKAAKTSKSTPTTDRFRPPPPPINTRQNTQRRRKRGGGFYPVGYAGEYYDDEDLVDELLFAAEILAFDALTNDGYEIPEHEEPMFEDDNEDDIRNSFGGFSDSGDSWGSDDDYDSGDED